MRAMCKVGLVLAVAVLVTAPAWAQRGGRGGFFGGGMGANVGGLINNKGVQDELKLTPDQVTKAGEAMRSVFEKHQDDFAKLQDATPEERQAFMRKMGDEQLKAITEVLKPEQTKRLKEIQLQVQGPAAFANADTVASLKLTPDQKEKIKTISDDAAKDAREIFSGGARGDFSAMQENMKKVAAINKEAMGKIASVLTPDQKKTWEGMTGKSFNYDPSLGQRRGRGN